MKSVFFRIVLGSTVILTQQVIAAEGEPLAPRTNIDAVNKTTEVKSTNSFVVKPDGGVATTFHFGKAHQQQNVAALAALEETATAKTRKHTSAKVEYHNWLSHSFYRLVPQGQARGRNPAVPPASGHYQEFHYDRDGRLAMTVHRAEDGKRWVSDVMLYQQGRPHANVAYQPDGQLSLVDVVCYSGNEPYLSCRVLGDGSVVLVEWIKGAKEKVN
jgi:hypothetical protein